MARGGTYLGLVAETTDLGSVDADEGTVGLDAPDDSAHDLALDEVADLNARLLDLRVLAKAELDLVLDLVDADAGERFSRRTGGGKRRGRDSRSDLALDKLADDESRLPVFDELIEEFLGTRISSRRGEQQRMEKADLDENAGGDLGSERHEETVVRDVLDEAADGLPRLEVIETRDGNVLHHDALGEPRRPERKIDALVLLVETEHDALDLRPNRHRLGAKVVRNLRLRHASSHGVRNLDEEPRGDLAADFPGELLADDERREGEVGRLGGGLGGFRRDEADDDESLVGVLGHDDEVVEGLALGELGAEEVDGRLAVAGEGRVAHEGLDPTRLEGEDEVRVVERADFARENVADLDGRNVIDFRRVRLASRGDDAAGLGLDVDDSDGDDLADGEDAGEVGGEALAENGDGSEQSWRGGEGNETHAASLAGIKALKPPKKSTRTPFSRILVTVPWVMTPTLASASVATIGSSESMSWRLRVKTTRFLIGSAE